MTTVTPVQAGVSLEALLAAKESRAARQADWLTHYQQPIISLTLVTPGRLKTACAIAIPWAWRCRCAINCCGKMAGRYWIARSSGCLPAGSYVVRGASGAGNQSPLCGAGTEPSARAAVGSRRYLPTGRTRGTAIVGESYATLSYLR